MSLLQLPVQYDFHIFKIFFKSYKNVRLAEWSKAVSLSLTLNEIVGSNPSPDKMMFFLQVISPLILYAQQNGKYHFPVQDLNLCTCNYVRSRLALGCFYLLCQ